MATFASLKVVSTLPAELLPNALYFVRVGEGFDLYCSDVTGQIAHQVNAVTSVAGKTGEVLLSASDISGLGNSATRNVGTTSGTVAAGDDPRLSNAREWTASVVTQAEAKAGTATTARKWTAQRVRQAVDASAGSAPNELPTNQHLGALAFLDAIGATQVTQHTRDSQPGDVWHEWVSDTQLRKKFHGLDGVIRTITETYA